MPKQVYLWKTKDGRLIDVDEMSIDHLRNTLKMIMRLNESRQRGMYILRNNFKISEAAQDFNDAMDDSSEDEDIWAGRDYNNHY
jgi:hypothetical protein